MSSTDLDAPPLRSILIAIIIVVTLHVLTAVALVAIKPPEIKIEPEKDTPPIEIEMVTLPTEPVESVVAEAEVVPKSKPQPTSEPKPKPQPKPKPVAQEKPVIKEKKPAVQKEKPPQKKPIKEKKIEDKPPEKKQSNNDKAAADERRRIIAAQAEKAAQEAHAQEAKRLADAKAAREAQALAEAKTAREAEADAKKAQEIANAKAKAEAAAAQAKADAEAKAAASKEPINYGNIGKSSWLREPIFTSITRKNYGFEGTEVSVSVSMSVDSNGNIGNMKISKSSGNDKFDRDFVRALSKAKLNPATKDNTPIKSTAILPFKMNLSSNHLR